jgi:murein DD-endopeptidase MepM/ murein hydrolase activator NlpD
MLRRPSLALLAAILPLVPGVARAGVHHEWDRLEKLIRDNLIPPAEARTRIRDLYPALRLQASGVPDTGGLVFPVEGVGPREIGGRNGSGYVRDSYRYFDGKRHTGHPAHDIFVHDRDQDGRVDRTGQPARVLAFAAGVVVSVNRGWEPGSELRGGNYVWLYLPRYRGGSFACYAHLDRVAVEPGDVVRAGDPLGTVGRSGRNAWARRSPTHLHFTVLEYADGGMLPLDPYRDLLTARRIPSLVPAGVPDGPEAAAAPPSVSSRRRPP